MKNDVVLMFAVGFATGLLLVFADSYRKAATVQERAATCEYPVDEATAQYIRGWNAAFDALVNEEVENDE